MHQRLLAVYSRFVPPAPKARAPVKVKVAPKIAKPPTKPPRKLYKVKSYDAAIKYAPPIEEPHPATHGFRTRIV